MDKNQGVAAATPYHHGALRTALIGAADSILATQGLAGFSLRAAARLAGVSVAAPAHHFGSAAGLLCEVAALGFIDLARQLDVDAPQATPLQRLRLQGQAYVRFAVNYPGRFQLMFRRDLLGDEHPGLQEAAAGAWRQLERTVRLQHGLADAAPLTPAASAMLLGAWSVVHGFAHLLLDGKLDDMHGNTSVDDLLGAVLPQMLSCLWPDQPAQ